MLFLVRLTAIQKNDLYDLMVTDRKIAEQQNYGGPNSFLMLYVMIIIRIPDSHKPLFDNVCTVQTCIIIIITIIIRPDKRGATGANTAALQDQVTKSVCRMLSVPESPGKQIRLYLCTE